MFLAFQIANDFPIFSIFSKREGEDTYLSRTPKIEYIEEERIRQQPHIAFRN